MSISQPSEPQSSKFEIPNGSIEFSSKWGKVILTAEDNELRVGFVSESNGDECFLDVGFFMKINELDEADFNTRLDQLTQIIKNWLNSSRIQGCDGITIQNALRDAARAQGWEVDSEALDEALGTNYSEDITVLGQGTIEISLNREDEAEVNFYPSVWDGFNESLEIDIADGFQEITFFVGLNEKTLASLIELIKSTIRDLELGISSYDIVQKISSVLDENGFFNISVDDES